MDDELDKQFKFYLENQDTFVEQYDGKVIVLNDEEVLGELNDTMDGGLPYESVGLARVMMADTFHGSVRVIALGDEAVHGFDLCLLPRLTSSFAAEVKPALTDRLDALAEFLPKFESP